MIWIIFVKIKAIEDCFTYFHLYIKIVHKTLILRMKHYSSQNGNILRMDLDTETTQTHNSDMILFYYTMNNKENDASCVTRNTLCIAMKS